MKIRIEKEGTLSIMRKSEWKGCFCRMSAGHYYCSERCSHFGEPEISKGYSSTLQLELCDGRVLHGEIEDLRE
jgi:hypothetical protein